MMSVFDGCAGCERPGRSLRSNDRFGEWPREAAKDDPEDERERGGVDTEVAMSGDVEDGASGAMVRGEAMSCTGCEVEGFIVKTGVAGWLY